MAPPAANILSYCATFLPQEMLHVYRQVSGVRRYTNWLVTRTRANADRFPYPRVAVLRKSPWRFLARLYYRAAGRSVPVSSFEIRQMLALAERTQAVLAHAYLGTEALRVLPFLERFPGARLVSFHGADLSDRWDAAAYQPLWPRSDFFLCRSESLRQLLLAKGCPAERIRLNFTGVPVPENVFPRVLPAWRSGASVRLLQVCRFMPKKGLDVTLHAVSRLKAHGVPLHLTLAGDGPDWPRLTALVGELGLQGEVTFAGFLSTNALERLYIEHDLFVHPSRTTVSGDREGIPNSLLEAMSFGLPVVATRHSGIPEAVTDGASGLLIDQAEPEAMANAIWQLLQNAKQYAQLSEGARHIVCDRFSTDKSVENLERVYAEAIDARPLPAKG